MLLLLIISNIFPIYSFTLIALFLLNRVKVYPLSTIKALLRAYRDRDIKYMTKTQWLVEIYNDAAHKSWS